MNTSSSNTSSRFKGALLTFFALLLAFATASEVDAGSIGPDLHARLLSASPQQAVPVIVELADRVDLHRYRGMEKRQAQKSLVADLKSRAERAQGPVIAFLNRAGIHGARQLWINNSLALSVPPPMVGTLAALPGVEEVRLDATIQAPVLTQAAPTGPPEWNIDAIGAPVLWSMPISFTGQGVVVATFDTGVDINHPDIGPKWRGGGNSWFDPYTPSTTPYEGDTVNGHGTAVLGLIVGGENGGTAIGVAPDARWIAAKIFDDAGAAITSAIHSAFQWALDPDGIPGNGDEPDIVNHSWGLDNIGTCSLEFDPDVNALRAAGIAVVFSAGNDGPNPNSSISPGNNAGSLAIGMTDDIGLIHPLSSRGPSPCDAPGLPFPELVAPGVAVKTTGLTGGGTFPNSYVFATGTSFSAPHVSGAMALLLSAFPATTVAELEAVLAQSADDLGPVGPDGDYGHGLIDVSAAFDLLAGVPNLKVNDPVAPGNDRRLPFGSVAPGSSDEQVLTLTNAGGGTLDILAVGSALAAPFAIASDLCQGQSLAAGASCTVTVRFSPPTFGDFAAALDIASTDPLEPVLTLNLSGIGNSPPAAATLLSPANGATGLDTDVSFQWNSPVDPDGDPVTNSLLISKTSDFSLSTPIAVSLASPAVQAVGGGGLLLLCGLLPLCRRKRHLLYAALIAGLLALVLSCGGSGDGSSSVPSPTAAHTVTGLDPATTYSWKIVSDDGRGGTAESAVWQFTTR